LTLVAGYQSRSNHRAIFTGSMSMCADEFLASFAGRSSNQRFCEELIDWAMQESGVLRTSDIKHRKVGTDHQGVNPENYFIEDTIEYFVTIHQKTKGKWLPFKAADIQFSFKMLDPYITTALPHQGNGVYSL
jgi:hypothetical protein